MTHEPPSTADLVGLARSGRPVWISTVRQAFGGLSPERSWSVECRVTKIDGARRVYELRLPPLDGRPAEERAFVVEYFLASMYNVLSTVGARRIDFVTTDDVQALAELVGEFDRAFGVDLGRKARRGFGRSLNVIERMLDALPDARRDEAGRALVFERTVVAGPLAPTPTPLVPVSPSTGVVPTCRAALRDLAGRSLLGIDVGGTDIKVALALDGRLASLLEYDWFPASFTRIEQLVEPMVSIVRLMRLEALRLTDPGLAEALGPVVLPVLRGGADLPAIEAAVRQGEGMAAGRGAVFDGIGMCFPDVVVRDKIVGGEVYKTRGIRDNPQIEYEGAFRRLGDLDVLLRGFVRDHGVVGILNDGPMAAFTAAAELSVDAPHLLEDGIFAHTLGTELGTGWIEDTGAIPDIPLEVYNCVIDLGSYPEREFEADDVRSVRNFNTGVPGTLQKYTSQAGVFRLAQKYLPTQAPDLFDEVLRRGYLQPRDGGWRVPTEPEDLRKPFLEHLMGLADGADREPVRRIFREVGEFLAVAWSESRWLMAPRTDRRILFGRMVKHPACFDLMCEGARAVMPELELVVADDGLACSDLMRELGRDPRRSVAQFAQAVGAVHYANLRLSAHGGAGARTA